jgi:hypothetical protein
MVLYAEEKLMSQGMTMSDAAKEFHNYGRILLAATLSCIVGLVAVAVTDAYQRGKIEQRVFTVEQKQSNTDKKVEDLDGAQRGMTGRLATIEERTGNIVKGLDRIEDKLERNDPAPARRAK